MQFQIFNIFFCSGNTVVICCVFCYRLFFRSHFGPVYIAWFHKQRSSSTKWTVYESLIKYEDVIDSLNSPKRSTVSSLALNNNASLKEQRVRLTSWRHQLQLPVTNHKWCNFNCHVMNEQLLTFLRKKKKNPAVVTPDPDLVFVM